MSRTSEFTLPFTWNTLSTIPCHQLEGSFLDELLTVHSVYMAPHIPVSLLTPYLFSLWHAQSLKYLFVLDWEIHNGG